jgi:hypothetical protein
MLISPRHLWIALQLLVIVPFVFSFTIVVEMTFAIPGGSYFVEPNKPVQCEALVISTKAYMKSHCATFGSKETNPGGYVIAVTSLSSLGIFLWVSSRPRRGLRLGRSL